MKVLITPPALKPEEKEFLLPVKTVTSLWALTNKGHTLGCDLDRLTTEQTRFLLQEGIILEQLTQIDSDIIIDREDKTLVVLDHDLEVLHRADNWAAIERFVNERKRTARKTRTTKETDIHIWVDLDGSGKSDIQTGLPFFDHMLEQIARHGFIDLEIHCKGDLHIDEHHTIEDVAISLGECLNDALGEKRGIERYGFVLAMDEALATIALDLSGRPYLVFNAEFTRDKVGDFPTEMTKHFFYSLAMGLKATLNMQVVGENDHHKIEALFKGFARSLKQAVSGNTRDPNSIPSSKGTL